ncbi:MAG: polysaccharide ABC transporter ATP-binding protein [Flavobacteriia bacterium]
MNSDIAIKAAEISKIYSLGIERDSSLRSALVGLVKKRNRKVQEFSALNKVSFEIRNGDVVGIIGKNGAGKSTLLKILSQITKPTEGKIEIQGRIASLLEVGTGFHPELTGRENIFLNGTILGMSRKEVSQKFDEIVDFSGVEKFIDTPVKHYSSGMYVRLAFAVAAHLEPEILIIDEVLAVGDSEFQKKCLGKMKEVASRGRTVLFVSHNLTAVAALCNKGIVLDRGKAVYSGTAVESINEYYKLMQSSLALSVVESYENEYIRLISFEVKPAKGDIISVDSGLNIELVFENKLPNATIDSTFELRTIDDVIVFHRGTYIDEENSSKKGTYSITGKIDGNLLNAGSYYFNLIFGQNATYSLMICPEILSFELDNSADENGYKLLPGILKPELHFQSVFVH